MRVGRGLGGAYNTTHTLHMLRMPRLNRKKAILERKGYDDPKSRFWTDRTLKHTILFGAAALSRVTQKEADSTFELLLENGIDRLDAAASYGEAELRIGPWMKDHRKDFFLATKTENRTYQGAIDELQRSLERLQALPSICGRCIFLSTKVIGKLPWGRGVRWRHSSKRANRDWSATSVSPVTVLK